jgi:hypothetical protein
LFDKSKTHCCNLNYGVSNLEDFSFESPKSTKTQFESFSSFKDMEVYMRTFNDLTGRKTFGEFMIDSYHTPSKVKKPEMTYLEEASLKIERDPTFDFMD